MADLLTLSKITAPLLPPTTLYRASLIQKLNKVADKPPGEAFSYKLILLCAPAGYGKTLLLADFARHTSIPCCWYFLDQNDGDRACFLTTLLASIRQRFPTFGPVLDGLLASTVPTMTSLTRQPYSFEEMMDALLATMKAEITERFALFFCNYHEISQNKSINALINHFLAHLPTQCIVVIESRTIPPLEFAPLITQRKILSLGRAILRFTPQEIRDLALLQGNAPLSEAEAGHIADSFDGWIAGILLSTRLGEIQFLDPAASTDSDSPLSLIQGSRKELLAYFLTEVFGRDLATYAFLKDASILQYMLPSICNRLLQIDDAGERLRYLAQQGLFVVRSGEEPEVFYTCHPFVRELLSDELRRQEPEHFARLHRRAAELFHAAGDHNQALYHAFQTDRWHIAESIIIEVKDTMLARGQVETLARWLDDLLVRASSLHSVLLLVRARIHLIFGEDGQALSLLETAARAIDGRQPLPGVDNVSILQAEVALLRSKVLFQKREYAQAQALCRNVLNTVSVEEIDLRADAYACLAIGENLIGDFHTGIAYLQKALHLWGRDAQTRQTADLHSALASTYGLIGNFALAEHHLARAFTCWKYLHNDWGKIDNLIRAGLIKHYQGDLGEAEVCFTRALALSRGPIHFRREEAYTLVSLGELHQNQGLSNHALACLDDGLALALQMEDGYLTNYAYRTLALTHLLIGDASTALLLVSKIDLHSEQTTSISYERTLRELVYGTILLHQKYAAEACTCLIALEKPLSQMGLKREQVQLTLRLAACQLALGNRVEVIKRLEALATTAWRDNLEYFITTELHSLPDLEYFVKTQQAMVQIRTYLRQASDIPDEPFFPEIPRGRTPGPTVVTVSSRRPVLAIQGLGEPAITLDGVPVTNWHLARAMELAFFLLEKNHPVHKDQILEALWPEMLGQVEQTLRTNVYYARKALGSKAILYQSGAYELKLAPLYKVVYDVASFQEHARQACEALEVGKNELGRDHFLKMVDLYRGDYVRSFYSDWCSFRRDELRQAYLDARRSLAQMAWSQELFDESLSHWKHMLIVDGCLEEAHYGLMRCYLRQGKRSLVLRQYQRCAETLKSELGIKPGPALQNLYQQIIASPEAR
ncbi:MAG TPA: BTAD domain-containing putative transcriptional regulator [Ktedonobacteraceae bacterium]